MNGCGCDTPSHTVTQSYRKYQPSRLFGSIRILRLPTPPCASSTLNSASRSFVVLHDLPRLGSRRTSVSPRPNRSRPCDATN